MQSSVKSNAAGAGKARAGRPGQYHRLVVRRFDCPYIFHRNGQAIGNFRKLWQRACTAIGLAGRLVHDLRRSGVKHLIDSGIDPHTVMAFSGHRTPSMLAPLPHHRSRRPAAGGGEGERP